MALDVEPSVGLTTDEADRRRVQFGPNRVDAAEGRSAWKTFLLQFHNPLVYLLLGAAGITGYLGEWVDVTVIVGVVLVNAVIGFVQEARAERSIQALARGLVTAARVRRDGGERSLNSENLVPGDVVLLRSGDRVPADLRLIRARHLNVDESALTGESVPVEKRVEALSPDVVLADRANLAYAGTLVASGLAEGIVFATGNRTETGRIARLIAEADEMSTPLTRKMAVFGKVLLVVVLGLAAVAFAVGVARGEPAAAMFMAAVALAVGAVPEGLPSAVTITLAIGVARMARRRAIIRRLPAVETLGSTTVICTDKTGTLTENQMTVEEVWAGGCRYTVTGAGYEPAGRIEQEGAAVETGRHPALAECLRAGVHCNDSRLRREGGRLQVQGDPTEAALLVAAAKAGQIRLEEHGGVPIRDMIPFESEHRYRATLHDGERGRVIYVVGALERVLERCQDALDGEGRPGRLDVDSIHGAAGAMAGRGLRVLALARRAAGPDLEQLDHGAVAGGLTFLGLQGMMDPPRPEVAAAIRRCRGAGIRVKMITGDHALTAGAIARQIGLGPVGDGGGAPVVATGLELDGMSDAELGEAVERVDVFARVAPEQKLRLVRALQARGHVVAMTGDGVNDAPALKQADIGVAMGVTGTDVAKGAADMVLTDDNFATIEAAVEEGRNVFDNLTKFIIWTLPTNFGQGLIILAGVAAGVALPILPVQLLWVNMTTVVLLGLMLVFEPREADLMQRPPRGPRAPLMTRPLFMRIGLVSILMMGGAFGLYLWEQRVHGTGVAEARTAAVNVVVAVLMAYLLNCRSLTRSWFSLPTGSNPWLLGGLGAMVAAQAAFTHLPLMNRLFHTAPLDAAAWWRVALIGALAFLGVELEKFIRERTSRKSIRGASHAG